MGYDAHVICNCYKEGKTSEPPYKQYVSFDDDGPWLNVPQTIWDTDEELAFKIGWEFDEWKMTACKHENLRFADERIANISGMGQLKWAISKLGGLEKYPILTNHLPKDNSGMLPVALATGMLAELAQLESETMQEKGAKLFEKSSGNRVISTHIYGDLRYFMDIRGFVITVRIKLFWKKFFLTPFVSMHFIQKSVKNNRYKFIDVKSGHHFTSIKPVYSPEGEPARDYELEVVFTNEPIIDDVLIYIIGRLKKLMKASIETGNPVIWS